MIKCQHKNVTITEHILSKRTYVIRDGHLADMSSGCDPMPRVFEIQCQDCDLKHIYRYKPGEFGPQASPQWLYGCIELTVAHNWKLQLAPENRRKRRKA